MFTFFKRARPAQEIADVLWTEVRDGDMTREMAAAASEDRSRFDLAVDEVVYFRSFAMDLTIHRVFQHDTAREAGLRESFLQRLRDYAIARRCAPCPVGDWITDSPNWHILSPGRDVGDPLQHLSDRFDLYLSAMQRPTDRFLPVVCVLCGLCDAHNISFMMLGTSCFVDGSIHTQEFLRKVHVKP
jgi:hypothetical protein